MHSDTDRVLNDASAEILQEYVVLDSTASCEATAVSKIIGRAAQRFRSHEPTDGFVQGVMQGVVRGTLGTHMDARQTARGAITGILRAVHPASGSSRLTVFTSAARSLILETCAQGGRFDATVRGILDAAFSDAGTGLIRQQVMSVVSTAILDATMESIRHPRNKSDTSRWSGSQRPGHVDGGPEQVGGFQSSRMKWGRVD